MSAANVRGRLRAAMERAIAPSYSTCYRCNRPWKFVENHTTMFSDNSGCFPLCETCWAALETPAARMVYYDDEIKCFMCDGTARSAYEHPSREGTEYLGVVIDRDTLIKAVVETGTYGVLGKGVVVP